MDYDDVRDPMPLPGQDGYNDYIETNEKLHVCDIYTSEIATEAARNGDYDAALQIFEPVTANGRTTGREPPSP